jgi:hypothetical protein
MNFTGLRPLSHKKAQNASIADCQFPIADLLTGYVTEIGNWQSTIELFPAQRVDRI